MAPFARFGLSPRADELPFTVLVTVAAAVGGCLLALSAYAIDPLVLPAAVIAVSFVVLTFVRPAWGLAGALAAVPAESFGLTVGGLSPSEGALALLGASWAVRAVIRPEQVARPQARDAPVVVLLAVIGLGLATAEDPFPIARVLFLWTLFYFVYLQVQTFTAAEMKLVIIAFALGAAVL